MCEIFVVTWRYQILLAELALKPWNSITLKRDTRYSKNCVFITHFHRPALSLTTDVY
jgi:hypothetical protein